MKGKFGWKDYEERREDGWYKEREKGTWVFMQASIGREKIIHDEKIFLN